MAKKFFGKRILIAEDDQSIKRVIQEAFAQEGAEIEVATSSNALIAHTMKTAFDLVIIGRKLEGNDSYAVLGELKEKGTLDDTAIIVLLVQPEFEDIEDGRAVGADAFLVKPISIDKLLKTTQKVLEEA